MGKDAFIKKNSLVRLVPGNVNLNDPIPWYQIKFSKPRDNLLCKIVSSKLNKRKVHNDSYHDERNIATPAKKATTTT